jgi:hypothetical protein
MTSRDEATRPVRGVTPARMREDRPLTVAMITRRTPYEHGGMERVVTSLLGELARTRPKWRVDTVSALRKGSRLEQMDGLSDVIATLRLGRQTGRTGSVDREATRRVPLAAQSREVGTR